MRIISAIYAIAMGIMMLGTWVILIATGQTPEFETVPFEASMLLAAEVMTGLALIVGGYGTLTIRRWGPHLHLLAIGMMLYTTVYSIGVFGQVGNVPATTFFVVITLVTMAMIPSLLPEKE